MVLPVDAKFNRHLIVLVPGSLAGSQDLARKVYWMAVRDRCNIQYLALADNARSESSIESSLDASIATIPEGTMTVQSRIVRTTEWLPALREIYQPGDRVACFEEQVVRDGFFDTRPLSAFLQDTLDTSILTISGFYQSPSIQIGQWLQTLLVWIGFLTILVGFTFLEIQLDMGIHGLAGKIILCMLLALEVGSIWVWNRITGSK